MHIIVHGKTEPPCPYCDKTKKYLDERGIPYEFIAYNDEDHKAAMYDGFGLEGNERTVPQIVVDGDRIGGYTALTQSDVADRFNAGKFDEDF